MGNKRTIHIATLPLDCSLKELLMYLGNVVERFTDAKVESADDYDDYSYYITIEVDKTDIDYQKEALEKKLMNLPNQYSSLTVPTREVIISQSTPIEEDVLEKIKNDGKKNHYWLRHDGCVLERQFTIEEQTKLWEDANNIRMNGLAEREVILKEIKEFRKLQVAQDAKYKLEGV